MDLKDYNEKRNFNDTPEPEGKLNHSKDALHFVVQKHDATNLHYDFRLEIGGVLISWAIPKGPSLNPKDKRLAMKVEDHPLSYKDFEGEIPEGNYGAGKVIVWDEGTYHHLESENKEESERLLKRDLEKGSLKFVLNGKKLKGEFSIFRFKNAGENSWLLAKKNDEFASEEDVLENDKSIKSNLRIEEKKSESKSKSDKFELGKNKILKNENESEAKKINYIQPMLATLVKEPFNDSDWIYEVKLDGYRAIAEIKNNEVNLYSRNGKSFKTKYKEVVEALSKINDEVIVDGEIVVSDEAGKFNFQMLQNYQRKKEGNLFYYVFDILSLNGKDLRNLPLIQRKSMLKNLLLNSDSIIKYCDHIIMDGIQLFENIQRNGYEGVVAKRSSSFYKPGERSKEWLKIKTSLRQEAVICGYTEPKGTRKYFGALILAVYEKAKLKYVGHVGGGFDNESLEYIFQKLEKRKTENIPFDETPKTNAEVHWVKPELICDVTFTGWTEDGQMRHPIFVGLREDKHPEEVKREIASTKDETDNERNEAKSKSKTASSTSSKKLRLTNLDKLYWEDENISKGDLIEYYKNICEFILPYLKDRPHTLLRHPNGINGQSFFQKDVSESAPEWIKTIEYYSESTERNINYFVCTNQNSLLYMVNLGCIEINPWLSRIKKLENPDYLVIDLDPLEIGFDKVIETALTTKEVLEEAHAHCFCKTSGATGLHIYVPLRAKYEFEIAKNFAQLLAQVIHSRLPEITSLERNPEKRKGKVYIDYLQNRIGQTIAAPYSVRSKPGAPVSTPLLWEEVKKDLDPTKFNMRTIFDRVEDMGDIFKGILGAEINIVKSLNSLAAYSKINS